MSNAGWIIERNVWQNKDADITGPRTYVAEDDTHSDLTIKFRLYDDDGNLYFTGRMNEASLDEYGMSDPLYNYGYPDSGAVRLDILQDGKWTTV